MDEGRYKARHERRKRRGVLRAVIKALLAVVISLPLIFVAVWGGSRVLFPKTTEISGMDKDIARKASNDFAAKVTVTNPYGRELELQKLNEKDGKWETKRTFETGDEEKSVVKVKFPKSWNKRTYSKWRLYMPGKFGVKKFVGNKVNVTCRNRGGVKIKCSACVVYCKDDDSVIFEQNMNKKLPNASTTKMITAILAIENSDLSGVITVSRRAVRTMYPTFSWRTGDKFLFYDLMKAMMIASSNNSATAIAERIGGTYEKFQKMMNKRAKELGCRNTHFVTPSGLDANGHHSTAYDLAMINSRAVELKEYNKLMKIKKLKFRSLNHGKRKFESDPTNELLEENIKGYMGGKTGTTPQAGHCLSSGYKYKGKTYIIVVLNASSRVNATKALMKYVRDYA